MGSLGSVAYKAAASLMPRHYPHAPIVEAVIDLQTQPGPDVDDRLRSFRTELTSGFPIAAPIHAFEVSVGFTGQEGSDPQTQSEGRTEQVGWRLSNDRRVLQFQRRGFTYSHLAPYTDW